MFELMHDGLGFQEESNYRTESWILLQGQLRLLHRMNPQLSIHDDIKGI